MVEGADGRGGGVVTAVVLPGIDKGVVGAVVVVVVVIGLPRAGGTGGVVAAVAAVEVFTVGPTTVWGGALGIFGGAEGWTKEGIEGFCCCTGTAAAGGCITTDAIVCTLLPSSAPFLQQQQ